jgi:predicted component of type VI protein secretion system
VGIVFNATVPLVVGRRRVAAGTPRLLRHGDRVSVGPVAITVLGDPPPEGTRELAGAMVAGLVPTLATGPGLLILEGLGAGRRFPMGPRVVIGRGAEADLVLADPLVSRRHVELTRSGEMIRAHDVGSKNGLVVNGRRHHGRGIVLRSGDELVVGETVLALDEPSSELPEQQQRRGLVTRPRPETIAMAFASAALLAAALLLARAAG